MWTSLLSPVLGIGEKILDRVIPDPEQKAQAKMELRKLEQEGEFQAIEVQLRAIVAEANSQDPWTSRARPSFMYVMYLLLLGAIPYGICYACRS